MIRQQFIRYVVIGVGLNAAFYLIYLLLSWRLLESRSAMTLTFCAGTLSSFLANRNITFQHRGGNLGALLRFLASYAVLYAINVGALWFFYERVGVAHQLVQGAVMLVLPLLGFTMQKYWVFPHAAGDGAPIATGAER